MLVDLLIYLLLFLFAAVEGGEGALFLTGYLLGTHTILLWVTLPLIGIAIFWGDLLYYYLGPRLYTLPVVRNADHLMTRFDAQIQKRPFMVALFARFSYGFHHLLIARYRANGISVGTMARILVTTGLVWLALLGGIVFLLAEHAARIKHYLHYVEFLFAGVFVGLILVEVIVSRQIRKRLKQPEAETTAPAQEPLPNARESA